MTSAPTHRLALGGGALLILAAALAWAPSLLLVLLAGASIGALIWLCPVLGLMIVALGVPFGSLMTLPLAAGALTLTPLVLAWAAFGWLLGRLGERVTGIPRVPVVGPLAIYIALLGAAAWRAPDSMQAAFEIARWAELGLALFLTAVVTRDPRRRSWLLVTLLAAGAAAALVGITWSFTQTGPEAFAIGPRLLGRPLVRAFGTFGQPNPFGGFMNLVWPIGIGLVIGLLTPRSPTPFTSSTHAVPSVKSVYPLSQSGVGKSAFPLPQSVVGFAAGAALLAGCGLVLSWSRGAWLAAAAAAVAMGLAWLASVLRPPVPGRSLFMLWAGLVLALALLLAGAIDRVPAGVSQRLASIATTFAVWGVADAEVNDASFATIERVAHWEAAARMWADHPWLGQGPGQYALVYPRYRLPRWAEPLGHAHNYYLHTLAEAGVLGLMGYLIFFSAALRLALKAALHPRTTVEYSLGLGLVGVLAAVAVHSLVDNVYVHELTVTLGLLLGLTAAAGEAA